MKKGIEWLKKEIATEMIELEPNRKERWSDVRYQTLRNVAQKIDQLDELKVLSQEWIDNNVVHVRGLGDIFEAVAVESLLVPKQEFPVIPQFVADWYEENEDDLEFDMFNLVVTLSEKGYDELTEIEAWFNNFGNEPIETIMRMKLFGYEVEKEKLYRVELPTERLHHILTMHGDGKGHFFGKEHINNFWYKTYLTEQEIKAIDERFWPFAVEVAE